MDALGAILLQPLPPVRQPPSVQAAVASLWQVARLRPGVALVTSDEAEGLGLDVVVGREPGASLPDLYHVVFAFLQLLARHRTDHVLVHAVREDALQHDDA